MLSRLQLGIDFNIHTNMKHVNSRWLFEVWENPILVECYPRFVHFSMFQKTQVGKDAYYTFYFDDLVERFKNVPKDCTVTPTSNSPPAAGAAAASRPLARRPASMVSEARSPTAKAERE